MKIFSKFILILDGKIFQEKVQSIMYLRHSSSGGKSVTSPGFMIISPSDFTASPPEGKQTNKSDTESVALSSLVLNIDACLYNLINQINGKLNLTEYI